MQSLKIFIPLVFSFLLYAFISFAEQSHYVLVSVAPHKYFVEKIAGKTVSVGLMVPAGSSAHTYEPTPKQMIAASKADAWFRIGEGFEVRAMKSLTNYNKNLEIIDLRQGMDMISADPNSGCACCHANSQDLHIWLSARQAKIQAKTIATALIKLYPANEADYQTGLNNFLKELETLDQQITTKLHPLKNRLLLVSHPAYAYFCRDYQLTQLSIEFEGKDPTPQQLNNILIKARAAQIKKVFIQAQYPSKGARLFAQELNAKIIMLDPYAENYIPSMHEIADQIASEDQL